MKDYDKLYGINIDEYCQRQGTTVDGLIHKSEVDIEILYENLDRLMRQDLSYEEGHIVDTISFLIRKKEKHIFALEDWKMGKGKKK